MYQYNFASIFPGNGKLFYLHFFFFLTILFTDGLHGKLGPLELHQSADLCCHLRVLVHKRTHISWDGIARSQNPHQDNVSACLEDLSNTLNGGPLQGQVQSHNSSGWGGLIILWESFQPSDLGLEVIDLQFVRLFLNSKGHLAPVLAEVLDPLEGGDELEGDKPLLVALDVLQQELILGDVGIGEVKLNLLNKC